jgi:Domain of unknown function (DUF4387)
VSTTTLADLAASVRSKNAGPFWVTFDVFFTEPDHYERAARSQLIDPQTISSIFGVDREAVRIFLLPDLLAVKISFPRPSVQGSLAEHDVHAGQQYVPLLSLPVP